MIKNPLPWPKGNRCAATFSWDMDADSIIHMAHPDDANTRVSTMSYLRYGPQIAVERICDLFEKYGLKTTFFCPAWSMEEHPYAVERILKGGHELAHHGYMHELPNLNTRDREAYWTGRAVETHVRMAGKKPAGYRAPWYNFSRNTIEILPDHGFLYDSSLMGDDVPYKIRSRTGHELVEIPCWWTTDDWPHYVHNFDLDYMMTIQPPRLAHEVYWSEFEAAYEFKGLWMCTWHPFVTGRASRMRYVEKMLKDMMKKGKVWITTHEEVARHAKKLFDSGKYTPRIDTLPYKDGRIPELAEDAVPLRG